MERIQLSSSAEKKSIALRLLSGFMIQLSGQLLIVRMFSF